MIDHLLLIDGDENSFKKFYEKFSAQVFNFFCQRTKSLVSSEDLTQITFIKFWKYRSSLKKDIALKAQLFRIARTTLIDYLRMRSKQEALLLQTEQVEHIAEQTYFDPAEEIISSIELLPEARKKVIHLKLEGLNNLEIAEALSISKRTVENHYYRAIIDLKELAC